MDYKDYYKILEVDKAAGADAIKKSYRRLARKYHPDFNKGNKAAEQRFKEINEAYQVLGDEEKRSKYDQLGADWDKYKEAPGGGFDPSVFAGFGDLGGRGGAGKRGGFSDFFRMFFGGAEEFDFAGMPTTGGPRRPRRAGGAAHSEEPAAELPVSVREAVTGTRQRLTLNREVPCDACGGRGLSSSGLCPRCGGRGVSILPEIIDVNIPPGVQTGSKVRLRGKGAPGPGGRRPDLFLAVRVQPDPLFRLEGRDVHCELPLTVFEAVLGAEIDCPTASGRVRMRIPPETDNGRTFRLKGKGLPALGSHPAGDQIVTVRVVLPRNLGEAERDLFLQLAALRRDNPRSGLF